MASRLVGYAAAVVVIIAIAVIAYVYTTTPSNNLFISLTDPANVPVGTQSLNVTYSSLMVHTTSGNASGWINVPGRGTLDLLMLYNFTTLLGSVHVANGTIVNMVRFNVTSASIALNNTDYPVTLPSSQITVPVLGANIVNGTQNLLTDLAPTVVTVITANSTVFIMVPSVKAVLIGSSTAISGRAIGSREALAKTERSRLNDITPNISISSASLSSLNNVTNFSVTVADNSNQSVRIKHIMITGNQSVFSNRTTPLPDSISTEQKTYDNNRSVISPGPGNNRSNPETPEIEHEASTFNFLVGTNGSLFLPSLESNFEGEGYNLSAGQSFTFKFSGKLGFGENHVVFNFVSGNTYKVTVQGERDSRASINITAS